MRKLINSDPALEIFGLAGYQMKKRKSSRADLIESVYLLESKLGRRPTKRDDNSLFSNARKSFGSWNNFMSAAGYEVRYSQKLTHITFDPDFPYLLGLLVTDGHIYYKPPKFVKVAFYTSFPEERDFIIGLIKKNFGYNASFSSKMASFNKKPNYEIRICSRKLADILNKEWSVPLGAKSGIVRIPHKIMHGTSYAKQLFLKGVIDGDGSITKWGVKIASGSSLFLNDLRQLLTDLGIHSGSIITERPTTFTIRINKKEDMLKLKKIYFYEPSYPRKRASINKI